MISTNISIVIKNFNEDFNFYQQFRQQKKQNNRMKAQNQMKMQISSTNLQNLDFLNNLTDRRLRVNITGFRYRFNQT